MTDLASPRSVVAAHSQTRPVSSLRQDWIVSLLGLWFLGGLFVDGWAHNNLSGSLESFFTPWHAVFYSGFLAVAAYHGWLMWQNHQQGYEWRRALPQGYEISLLGLLIFALGGAGDMLWHEILGIETGIDALFSPTHLLLAIGIALVVSGPWRATSYRLRTARADWRALLPLILSATSLLALFTFMTQFAYLFTDVWVLIGHRPGFDLEIRQVAGVMAALLQSALLMGIVLPLIRRWHLPPGTLTFMLTVNIALMAVMRDEFVGVPAAVLTGVFGDILLQQLRPSAQRSFHFHLFGGLLPFILYTLYIATVEITADSWWSVHMLAGLPVLTAIVGLLLSYLVLPPASLQSANL